MPFEDKMNTEHHDLSKLAAVADSALLRLISRSAMILFAPVFFWFAATFDDMRSQSIEQNIAIRNLELSVSKLIDHTNDRYTATDNEKDKKTQSTRDSLQDELSKRLEIRIQRLETFHVNR